VAAREHCCHWLCRQGLSPRATSPTFLIGSVPGTLSITSGAAVESTDYSICELFEDDLSMKCLVVHRLLNDDLGWMWKETVDS
jgi:hypothetical protein